MSNSKSESKLRIIKTARTESEINNAARSGLFPLVKKVSPSDKIRVKYAIFQNSKTGEIRVSCDFRDVSSLDPAMSDFDKVIDYSFYYPYHFDSPFAAYLIPKDLQKGERVMIVDLIEDIPVESWNQGDTSRLTSCEAVWNGEDFELNYLKPSELPTVLG
jgi:hypothetical protein